MPITEKQLAANRANGLKSTGPRTPEGKAAASMNAVRHGLFARTLLLPSEDPAQFEAFATGLLDDLRPEGPLETNIATRLVATAWRLRRVSVAEAAIFSPDVSAIGLPTAEGPGNSSAIGLPTAEGPDDESAIASAKADGSDPLTGTAPQSTGSNGFVSADPAHGVRPPVRHSLGEGGSSNQKLLTPSHANPPAPSTQSTPSTPPILSGPSDNPASPTAATTNSSAIGLPTAGPGAHYLRRLRPGADPLAGISRHEARLHRQFDRDLQLFDAARERRLKREREDREIALRRAQDPTDPLYDPALDPYAELRRRRLARAQARRRTALRPSAHFPPSPDIVTDRSPRENGFVSADSPPVASAPSPDPSDLAHSSHLSDSSHNASASPDTIPRTVQPQPAGENGFVSADNPHVAVMPSPDSSHLSDSSHNASASLDTILRTVQPQPSGQNGFVFRNNAHLFETLDTLYHDLLRIERRLGLPESNEEVEALA